MKLVCLFFLFTLQNLFIPTTELNDEVLIKNEVLREFSHPDKKDIFSVLIKGKSILEGEVVFSITSHDGKVILKEKFPSYLLMGHGFCGDINSDEDVENYRKQRIINFFADKQFLKPAISVDEEFDEDYSDKEIWDDIKSDSNSIGFSYHLGEGDGRRIAFSKKRGKVVLYFNCC